VTNANNSFIKNIENKEIVQNSNDAIDKTKNFQKHKNFVTFDLESNLDQKTKSIDETFLKNNFAKENTVNQENNSVNDQLQHRLKIRSMLLNNIDNDNIQNQKETKKIIDQKDKNLVNDIQTQNKEENLAHFDDSVQIKTEGIPNVQVENLELDKQDGDFDNVEANNDKRAIYKK